MKVIKVYVCVIILLFAIIFCNASFLQSRVFALEQQSIYVIYDEKGDYLFEREEVSVGDEFIDKNKNVYEVTTLDEHTKTGQAIYKYTYIMPKLKEKKAVDVAVANTFQKRGLIGMYMTHNDESYISGDGYDSVYGKGGIHDVAKMLKTCFEAQNVEVALDETLHIPHDTSAYSRSGVTAGNLLASYNCDALFDIHRDGASRGYYIANVNGEERCMVRMVVGKANANYEENIGFALYLMSVAEIYCPWLFVDIYMAKGHYNQALSGKSMLFEFGSHLVEKDLVLKTVPFFADVVSVALFGEFEVEENDKNGEDGQNELPSEMSGQKQNIIENSDNGGGQNLSGEVLNGEESGGSHQNLSGSEMQNGQVDGSTSDSGGDEQNTNNQYNGSENSSITNRGETGGNETYIDYVGSGDIEQGNQNETNEEIVKENRGFLLVVLVIGLLVSYVVIVSVQKKKGKNK